MGMLSNQLRQLLDASDGAIGAALVNSDGVIIHAESTHPSFDPASGLSEYGMVVQQLGNLNEVTPIGESTCCTVRSSARVTLIRQVSEHYFLALWLKTTAQVEKARFLLRLAVGEMRTCV